MDRKKIIINEISSFFSTLSTQFSRGNNKKKAVLKTPLAPHAVRKIGIDCRTQDLEQ
jgi:hypothetical protein